MRRKVLGLKAAPRCGASFGVFIPRIGNPGLPNLIAIAIFSQLTFRILVAERLTPS